MVNSSLEPSLCVHLNPAKTYLWAMSIHYQLSTYLSHQHFIAIELSFTLAEAQDVELVLPAWRPGRYELAEYAMNMKHVEVSHSESEALGLKKSSRNVWYIENCPAGEVKVNYLYYANVLNGGSCFTKEDVLYVNPVNCCLFVKGMESVEHILDLDIPSDFKVKGMLPFRKNRMKAKNADELFDSPFVAAREVLSIESEVSGVKTSIVFQGNIPTPPKDLEKTFKAFMRQQIRAFGGCPVDQYTYLILATPHRYYHGVEHDRGTVIALGPDLNLFRGSVYTDLLGVSSHEFYHTWNVKYMRPKEMWPYDFERENYHRIGYIIEGITTYQGDVKLWQSKVFSDRQFLDELTTHLNRHQTNMGRKHLSVRESSMDLWVDGYKQGMPDRKVSIYTEGALIALLMEIMVIQATEGKSTLDDVMASLYLFCQEKGRGYAETDFLNILSIYIGEAACKRFFKDSIDRAGSLHNKVIKALKTVGVNVKMNTEDRWASAYGLKFSSDARPKVTHVHPSSEAYEQGVRLGMELLAVNNYLVESDLDVKNVKDEVKLHLKEGKILIEKKLKASEKLLYIQFELSREAGNNAYWEAWKG
jgi:predicted metalloprotease with PDZ domain